SFGTLFLTAERAITVSQQTLQDQVAEMRALRASAAELDALAASPDECQERNLALAELALRTASVRRELNRLDSEGAQAPRRAGRPPQATLFHALTAPFSLLDGADRPPRPGPVVPSLSLGQQLHAAGIRERGRGHGRTAHDRRRDPRGTAPRAVCRTS